MILFSFILPQRSTLSSLKVTPEKNTTRKIGPPIYIWAQVSPSKVIFNQSVTCLMVKMKQLWLCKMPNLFFVYQWTVIKQRIVLHQLFLVYFYNQCNLLILHHITIFDSRLYSAVIFRICFHIRFLSGRMFFWSHNFGSIYFTNTESITFYWLFQWSQKLILPYYSVNKKPVQWSDECILQCVPF